MFIIDLYNKNNLTIDFFKNMTSKGIKDITDK